MAIVETQRSYGATPVDRVWRVLRTFERYPDFMDHVVSVELLQDDVNFKRSAWVVLFNGNELAWTEEDFIDDDARRIRFEQIDGDLAVWRGILEVTRERDTVARYRVEFDLGIPALADLLHPLGERAIESNCRQMLDAVAEILTQEVA
jgi:uncharacterized membrane protein